MAAVLWWLFVLSFGSARQLTRDEDCGVSKGCYHKCTGSNCDFLVTWHHLSEIQCIKLSLIMKVDTTLRAQWFALGLSRDMEMGDDSVIECVMDEHMNFADVVHSYNPDKYNVNIYPGKLGMYQTAGGVVDGILSCNLTRRIVMPSGSRIFSLDSPYFLFIGRGEVRDGVKLRHSLSPLPLVSPAPVDLRSTEEVDGTARRVLLKVHGCLMVYAWIFSASVALVLARFFKPLWPDNLLCRQPVWFSVHRFLMLTTFVAVTTGFVLIFVDRRDFSRLPGHTNLQRAHPVLGVSIACLTLLNPILACLRPKSGTVHRQVFKWSHTVIGVPAYILAVLNVAVGTTLKKMAAPSYTLWLIVAFAGYQVFVELTFELHEWYLIKSGKTVQFELDSAVMTTSSVSESSLQQAEPPGSTFKKVILALHVTVSLGVTAASIYILITC